MGEKLKTVSRTGRGRPEIDEQMCKGCELCIDACPENVLFMSEKTNAQGVAYAEFETDGICTACQSCAIMCPDSAIRIYKYENRE
jgi:2-oxoglutarate ferredoxin oxidoreductase subunit delta